MAKYICSQAQQLLRTNEQEQKGAERRERREKYLVARAGIRVSARSKGLPFTEQQTKKRKTTMAKT
jgi:hypothetical protein